MPSTIIALNQTTAPATNTLSLAVRYCRVHWQAVWCLAGSVAYSERTFTRKLFNAQPQAPAVKRKTTRTSRRLRLGVKQGQLSFVCFGVLAICLFAPNVRADYKKDIRPLWQKYCFDCHGPKKQEGEMRLDELDPAIGSLNELERWVDVGDKLKQGDMPPAKAAQPTVDELATLITWVSENVRESASRLARPERFQVRRLTREQYNATLQDLLGLPLNFVKELPAEALSDEGFSNDADLLDVSPLYIEYFLNNAERAIEKAVVSGTQPSGGYNFKLEFAPLAEQLGLKHGQFLKYGKDTPFSNVFYTMLSRMNLPKPPESFADNTGEL